VLRPKIKLLLDVSTAKHSLGSNNSEGEKQLAALIPNEERDKSKIDGIVDTNKVFVLMQRFSRNRNSLNVFQLQM